MIVFAKNGLSLLQFANLNQFDGLFHFSTTRTGGCSIGKYSSLNLGYNSGDRRENVLDNRAVLCKAIEIETHNLIFPKQTHTATVKTIAREYFDLGEADRKLFLNESDAVITNLKGVCIAVKTADCVPVLLFDPRKEVVAAIHAGWRGTVQNIVKVTIKKMADEFGTNPADLRAGIGPSISPEVYEVGEEVWNQFDPMLYCGAGDDKPEKRLLDLWNANFSQLTGAGIPSEQIESAKTCTLSNAGEFFSARRDGAQTGRMATGIMMKENCQGI
jgi:YfiH family protein